MTANLPTPRQVIAAAERLGDTRVTQIIGSNNLSGAAPADLIRIVEEASR